MHRDDWVLCPFCGNKTRKRIKIDTTPARFPLHCPKCKQETLVNVERMKMSVTREPDAKTRSRKI